MANQLDFVTALRFIPGFAGGSETDLASFISRCEFVFTKVPDVMKADILEAVLTGLKGKAFDEIRYRDIETWEELKSHLKTIFSKSHSLSHLRSQLNSMKLSPGESVKGFAQRVEKAYHELTQAMTRGKNPTEAKIHPQSIPEHALSVFIGAVPSSIELILLARNVDGFEEAVLFAIEQEALLFKTPTQTNRFNVNKSDFRNNTRSNYKGNFKKPSERANIDKSAIKCFRCDRMGHYANECRTPEQNIIKKTRG
ncbi:uncharacterized protein LOC126554021 [Aphis gossypii]|uniref:uncharacterized protein LOC126554021 n=1 Tax=Aphis gossypii TaxID=80765 RepID=UPI0021596D4C|nr:uncharacterized protein LOC126554021 [Aphis gossypii]